MLKHIAQQFDDGRPDSPLCDVFAHPAFDSLVPDGLDAQCFECKKVWYQRVELGHSVYGRYAEYVDALTNGDLWQQVMADMFAGKHQLDEDEDEPDWHTCIDCGLSHTSEGEVD